MSTVHRPRVILALDQNDIPELIIGSTNIQTKMTLNSATFTSPNPSMPVLGIQIAGLNSAQLLVTNTRAKGSTAARKVARNLLWSSLESECSTVQLLCDQNPENAENYAALAGMKIAAVRAYAKPILQAALTTVPGFVSVVANASQLFTPGKKKSTKKTYLWRASPDGGKTFITGDPTPVAHGLFPNLALGTVFGFQVAVKDSTGTSEWSQAVSILVH
jgi:hypothetical protein